MDIEQEPATLPRVLGPFDAMMVVVGSVIGGGIFLKPDLLAANLPTFGMIVAVWAAVGVITLCGCLSLAELAAMLPQAGRPYVYLREADGRMPAFLWGWTEFWIVRTGSIGALAVATSIFLSEVVPLDRTGQEVVSILLVLILSAVNYFSTRWTAHVQNITAVVKVAFLVLIVVLPFAMGRANFGNLTWFQSAGEPPPLPDMPSIWNGLAAALLAVLWAYDGWINIGPVVEEIHEPQRNVPLALAGGILLVAVVYIAANTAYHLVMPHALIAKSEAPAAEMFRTLFGPDAGRWVTLGVIVSTFGAVNSNMLTGPRIYFAVARDGLLPTWMHAVHDRFETPHNAVLLQCIWTIALILAVFHGSEIGPDAAFDALTNYVIFGGYLFYALAVSAVIVLRRKRPDLPRPYRTWGYPAVPLVFLVAFGAFVVSMAVASPKESAWGMVLIAAGIPAYFLLDRRGRRSATPESSVSRSSTA